MAQIGYIESLLGNISDLPTRLAIRRVAEELLGRIATLEAATGVVPDTPGGPITPPLENVAFTDQPNVFTEDQLIEKVRPELALRYTGDTAKSRLAHVILGARTDLTANLNFDGANWQRDDTTKAGTGLLLLDGQLLLRSVAAGANPATLVQTLSVDPAGHLSAGASVLAGTMFNFGARTSAFGGLRPNSTIVEVVLGDQSAYAPLRALTLQSMLNTHVGQNLHTTGQIYPGRVDVTGEQGSWYLASHGSYGLYTNTGFFIAGQIYGMPWTAYTPAWTSTGTQPNIGNGSIVGHYQRVGGTVHFKIQVTMGSTTTFGTGGYRLSLPVAPSTYINWLFTCVGFDQSTGLWWGGVAQNDTGSTINLRAGATNLNSWSPTAPVTWAANDQWHTNGSYMIG